MSNIPSEERIDKTNKDHGTQRLAKHDSHSAGSREGKISADEHRASRGRRKPIYALIEEGRKADSFLIFLLFQRRRARHNEGDSQSSLSHDE